MRFHGQTHIAKLERYGKGLILCPGVLEADPDFSGIPSDAVMGLFPARLMIDVCEYGLVLYKCAVDALFVYLSYDDERGYEVLLAVGIGLKRSLGMPFEVKLVLEGDSLADMLVCSIDDRERLRGRCLAGIGQGLHDEVFSSFEDEETVLLLLVMPLGIILWDGSEGGGERSPRRALLARPRFLPSFFTGLFQTSTR